MANPGDNVDQSFHDVEGAVGGELTADDKFRFNVQDALDNVLTTVAAIQGDMDSLSAKIASIVDASTAMTRRLDLMDGSFSSLSQRVTLVSTSQTTAINERDELGSEITQLRQDLKKVRQQQSFVSGRSGKITLHLVV